eukprot:7789603-Ditylum_brightwellii.AAC.1
MHSGITQVVGKDFIKYNNSSSYKGKGETWDLGGKHWWFGPGLIARNKANYLTWYPAYPGS